MAFHLHRLNLTGKPLRLALNSKARVSTSLSQARISISPKTVTELAATLGIEANALTRALSTTESLEWSFYRASAKNRIAVWTCAQNLWRSAGLSTHQAASLLGAHPSQVRNSVSGKRNYVLDRSASQRLLNATTPDLTPDEWLARILESRSSSR